MKLISKPKAAASRAKSAPRAGVKVEGSSKKRAVSVRIARSSGRGVESEPREPDKPEEPTTGAETDGDDSHIRWTEVTYGHKKYTDTKTHIDENNKSHNETNYQSNDYTEDAGWKGKWEQDDWQSLQKG